MTHRTMANRDAAVKWGVTQIDHPIKNYHALCLQFVRYCFHIDSRELTAADAWDAASGKHRMSDGSHVPRAVPFFWTGGSSGAGHIVLSIGGGMCLTNDFVRDGRINRASINAITRGWGQSPRGWAETLNGVRVIDLNAGKPAEGWEEVRLSALRPGDKNNDVFALKVALAKKLGSKELEKHKINLNLGDDDGKKIFGDNTREAVRVFQHRLGFTGMDADGLPGAVTLRRLGLKPVG